MLVATFLQGVASVGGPRQIDTITFAGDRCCRRVATVRPAPPPQASNRNFVAHFFNPSFFSTS